VNGSSLRGGRPNAGNELQRSVSWREATATIGRPKLRIHDLRHTAASVWLASGADPKVVQRVLGHATAAMTMDLYGAHDRPQFVGRGMAARGHHGGTVRRRTGR
jgi:integrase